MPRSAQQFQVAFGSCVGTLQYRCDGGDTQLPAFPQFPENPCVTAIYWVMVSTYWVIYWVINTVYWVIAAVYWVIATIYWVIY